METEKFGVAIAADLMQQLEKMKDGCKDFGASRSEIAEGVITIYFQADLDHADRIRGFIVWWRKRSL